jgi:hypothetical protein
MLIFESKGMAMSLGHICPLVLCKRVTTNIHLLDPFTVLLSWPLLLFIVCKNFFFRCNRLNYRARTIGETPSLRSHRVWWIEVGERECWWFSNPILAAPQMVQYIILDIMPLGPPSSLSLSFSHTLSPSTRPPLSLPHFLSLDFLSLLFLIWFSSSIP